MKTFETSSPLEKIKNYNALLGCIKYKDQYHFYLMPIAWWILDYKKYDPENSNEENKEFRNGIYTLTQDNKELFMESIREDEISIDMLCSIIQHYKKENMPYNSRLSFFISFDDNLYINGFYDLELEDYLPEGWSGRFDDPMKYIPTNFQQLW